MTDTRAEVLEAIKGMKERDVVALYNLIEVVIVEVQGQIKSITGGEKIDVATINLCLESSVEFIAEVHSIVSDYSWFEKSLQPGIFGKLQETYRTLYKTIDKFRNCVSGFDGIKLLDIKLFRVPNPKGGKTNVG